MSILVTGGAGYIGSHVALELLSKNEEIVIIDNMQKGHKSAILGGKFYKGDIRDREFMDEVFSRNDISAVIHFAANSLVGESVTVPLKYYDNNVYGTQCLLEKMVEYGVKHIVFSSTAATYGEPERIPIQETDRTLPTNPYGDTKLAIERMLRWCNEAYGIKSVCLRYFNAAGAHKSGMIGEDHRPETHLVPIVMEAALGKREYVQIFGDDYDTPDGTCIRDYIHVSDLAKAHILALESLRAGNGSKVYNLGNGEGFSVKEVIECARKVTGREIKSVISPRRAGDPAVLVASSDRIRKELGWSPEEDDLETILSSAWEWHRKHPDGYPD